MATILKKELARNKSGKQTVGSGKQTVGSGKQTVGSGKQTVGSGKQAVGSGKQTVGSGKQAVGSEQRGTVNADVQSSQQAEQAQATPETRNPEQTQSSPKTVNTLVTADMVIQKMEESGPMSESDKEKARESINRLLQYMPVHIIRPEEAKQTADNTETERKARNDEIINLINQFKAELEGEQLGPEQQGIYDVMTRQKDKTIIRVQDLDILREYVLLKGSRGKGAYKILTVHYAGKRGKVTAKEIINIGTVIRNGQYIDGDAKHPTSHTYEMTADDGARLRVVIDYDKQKNESVINFYSNRKAEDRAHQASSGKITDSADTVSSETGKSSTETEKTAETANQSGDELERLQALKNQAVREGGQILTSQDDSLRASSDHAEPGNLSNTVTPETGKSSTEIEETADQSGDEVARRQEEVDRLAKQLEDLKAEYLELASRMTTNEDKRFPKRPQLSDYLHTNTELESAQELGEDTEEAEAEDGEAKLSKAPREYGVGRRGYPKEWRQAFTQYSGKEYLAVQYLLQVQNGFVPEAFHREDIGDIDIVYGRTGTGIQDAGGYGLAHIRKRHPGMDWELFSKVIQTGKLVKTGSSRVNIVDGKSKVIVELEWKGQERKWVVSAMGDDLTSTADSLLASNPGEAAKQGIAPKGIITIGDLWEKSSHESGKFTENDGGTIKFSELSHKNLSDLTKKRSQATFSLRQAKG